MPSTEAVTVHILGKDYQISCKVDERENLLNASRELDQRMRDIRTNSSVVGIDRIAIIAALNLTDELLKLRDKSKVSEDVLLAKLHEKLDKALDQS